MRLTSRRRRRWQWQRLTVPRPWQTPQLTRMLPVPVHQPDTDDESNDPPPAGARLEPGGSQVTPVPHAVVQDLHVARLGQDGVAATARPRSRFVGGRFTPSNGGP